MKEMEGWTLAVARDRQSGDISPYMVRIRDTVPADISRDHYPYLLEVTWAFLSTQAGQPHEDEEARMDDFEGAIEDALDRFKHAVLMAVITGKGKRVWFWYVRDVESAEQLFNEALAGKEQVPIDINILLDGKWAQYDKIQGSAANAPREGTKH